MLIVTGTIEINPDNVEAARVATAAMVAETVKEAGCQVYEFSQIVGAEHRFRVYEEWDDEAALQAHMKTPHMAAFRAALGEAGIVSRAVYMVKGGEKAPLG